MAGALWTSYDASFPAIWVEKKPSVMAKRITQPVAEQGRQKRRA